MCVNYKYDELLKNLLLNLYHSFLLIIPQMSFNALYFSFLEYIMEDNFKKVGNIHLISRFEMIPDIPAEVAEVIYG